MIVVAGEKIHIVVRRRFEGDIRRHFVGAITDAEGSIVKAEGYTLVYNRGKNRFIKKPEKRFGFFDLASSGYLVNILPQNVNLDELTYETTEEGFLIFTDNAGFSLDINELGIKQ